MREAAAAERRPPTTRRTSSLGMTPPLPGLERSCVPCLVAVGTDDSHKRHSLRPPIGVRPPVGGAPAAGAHGAEGTPGTSGRWETSALRSSEGGTEELRSDLEVFSSWTMSGHRRTPWCRGRVLLLRPLRGLRAPPSGTLAGRRKHFAGPTPFGSIGATFDHQQWSSWRPFGALVRAGRLPRRHAFPPRMCRREADPISGCPDHGSWPEGAPELPKWALGGDPSAPDSARRRRQGTRAWSTPAFRFPGSTPGAVSQVGERSMLLRQCGPVAQRTHGCPRTGRSWATRTNHSWSLFDGSCAFRLSRQFGMGMKLADLTWTSTASSSGVHAEDVGVLEAIASQRTPQPCRAITEQTQCSPASFTNFVSATA